MPNSIVHSDLSKTVCKVLEHIGANRIVPQPQPKKAIIQYWNFYEERLRTGDKGQEGLKIFKSNWSRFSGRYMSIHKSQLVSLLQELRNDLSIYLSICLSIYLYYMYILILFVLCILSIVYVYIYIYIYIYICNILNNKTLPRPLVISK